MNQARFTIDEVVRATKGLHVPPAEASTNCPDEEGCAAVCTDSRSIAARSLFVALVGQRFDAHQFLSRVIEEGAFGAVVRRGAKELDDVRGKLRLFEVDDTLVALGDLARLHRDRFTSLKIAAITGSNGKTTTKELLARALAPIGNGLFTRGNLNNRIGVPLTLFDLAPEHRWAVVEMGMNEAGEIGKLTRMTRPRLGLVTTATATHLSGLGSVDAVAAAKAELYHRLGDGSTAVVNLDDPRLSVLAEAAGALEAGGRLRRLTYGSHPRADARLGDVRALENGRLGFQVLVSPALLDLGGHRDRTARGAHAGHQILEADIPLLGRHNAHNACGALAAAIALGVPPRDAARAIATVKPIARRLSPRPGPSGSLVLDDCYNSAPASVLAALETARDLAALRGGSVIAVLGDMLELGPQEDALHEDVGRAAGALFVSVLVAFGPKSAATARAARHAGVETVHHETEHAAVVALVAVLAGPGDVVLIKGSRGMALELVADPLADMGEEGSG